MLWKLSPERMLSAVLLFISILVLSTLHNGSGLDADRRLGDGFGDWKNVSSLVQTSKPPGKNGKGLASPLPASKPQVSPKSKQVIRTTQTQIGFEHRHPLSSLVHTSKSSTNSEMGEAVMSAVLTSKPEASSENRQALTPALVASRLQTGSETWEDFTSSSPISKTETDSENRRDLTSSLETLSLIKRETMPTVMTAANELVSSTSAGISFKQSVPSFSANKLSTSALEWKSDVISQTSSPTEVMESNTSENKNIATDDRVMYKITTPVDNQAVDLFANFSFIQILKYFDSLVCPPMASQCSPGAMNSSTGGCSPFWCPGCSCDACHLHRDCCLDAALDSVSQPDVYKPYRSCLTPTAKMADLYEERWYYFIDRCPALYGATTTKSRCEERSFHVDDIDNHFPVYSRLTRQNYINIYCARCHDDAHSLIPWEPEVFCYDALPLKDIETGEDIVISVLPRDQCVVTATPPAGVDYSPCDSSAGIVQKCNQSGIWHKRDEDVATACDSYKNTVRIKDVEYRNVFCAFCNGVPRSEVIAASSRRNCAEDPLPEGNTKKGSVPVMLSYNVKLRAKANSESMAECQEDEVYDSVKVGDSFTCLLCLLYDLKPTILQVRIVISYHLDSSPSSETAI